MYYIQNTIRLYLMSTYHKYQEESISGLIASRLKPEDILRRSNETWLTASQCHEISFWHSSFGRISPQIRIENQDLQVVKLLLKKGVRHYNNP